MKKISEFSKKFYQINEASLQSSHNKLKLVANRSAFLKILNSVIDGIPAKSADPNYMNFLITINDEEKTILASDGAITIIHSLSNDENPVLKSYEPGTIEIPARHFVSIISKLEGEEVILTQIENSFLNITDNYSNFNIKCSRGEEFPQLDIHFTSSHTFEIDGNDFLNLYNSTAFAVATRGPKKHFYGVKIGVNNNILEFVATDSYRLAQRKVAVENNEKFYFIAPVKALSLVAKYCEGKKVLISEDNNLASFKVDNLTVISRLYVGEFPNIDRIIPVSTPFVLNVDSKIFLNALDRVATILDAGKGQCVVLKCNEDGAELFARSEQVGNSADPLAGAEFEGNQFEISFNYSYVNDAIKALNSEKIHLCFASEGTAFLVKNDDPNNIQIVTPLRSSASN